MSILKVTVSADPAFTIFASANPREGSSAF